MNLSTLLLVLAVTCRRFISVFTYILTCLNGNEIEKKLIYSSKGVLGDGAFTGAAAALLRTVPRRGGPFRAGAATDADDAGGGALPSEPQRSPSSLGMAAFSCKGGATTTAGAALGLVLWAAAGTLVTVDEDVGVAGTAFLKPEATEKKNGISIIRRQRLTSVGPVVQCGLIERLGWSDRGLLGRLVKEDVDIVPTVRRRFAHSTCRGLGFWGSHGARREPLILGRRRRLHGLKQVVIIVVAVIVFDCVVKIFLNFV